MSTHPDVAYTAIASFSAAGRTHALLTATHTRGYASPSDEAYERDPICTACETSWPCDVAKALAVTVDLRAEVHHLLNPVIGWMRLAFHSCTGLDPLTVANGANGLPDVENLPGVIPAFGTSAFVSSVRRLTDATAAADAAVSGD